MTLKPGDRVLIYIPGTKDSLGYVYKEVCTLGTVLGPGDDIETQYCISTSNRPEGTLYHISWIHPMGNNVTDDQIEALKSIIKSKGDIKNI